MLQNLLLAYQPNLSPQVREALQRDFKLTDLIMLCIIAVYAIIVAGLTSWQNEYFTLGIVGGGLIFDLLSGSIASTRVHTPSARTTCAPTPSTGGSTSATPMR